MTTKADITTVINTIDGGGLNTASEVRDVLKDNTDSLLEAIYKSTVKENQSTASITTAAASGDFDYEVEIQKIGRRVTININVVNVTADYKSGNIFTITETGLLADPTQIINYNLLDSVNDNATLTISSTGTESSFNIDAIAPSTSYKGIIIYNSLN